MVTTFCLLKIPREFILVNSIDFEVNPLINYLFDKLTYFLFTHSKLRILKLPALELLGLNEKACVKCPFFPNQSPEKQLREYLILKKKKKKHIQLCRGFQKLQPNWKVQKVFEFSLRQSLSTAGNELIPLQELCTAFN